MKYGYVSKFLIGQTKYNVCDILELLVITPIIIIAYTLLVNF
jgi:hypothetical protein